MTAPVVLVPEPFDSPVATALLADLDADLDARYPGEGICPPVHDPADYVPPRGLFLVGRSQGEPVACGGVRPGPAEGTGEVKRMWVAPQARGRRIGQAVLERLGVEAARLGYRRLVLETGLNQPEALALYRRLGWTDVPAFGHYSASPLSVCLGRDLP